MNIKKRWIIWIIIIEILIAISLWASIKDETYDGEYYKYYAASKKMTKEYEQWMNEEKYVVIKNNKEFESYLDLLYSDLYNEEVYNKMKNKIDTQFFKNNSLIIFRLGASVFRLGSECELLSVDIQDENAKIRIKSSCYGIGTETDYYKLGIIYCIPINSKNINTIEINDSEMDIYDEITKVSKNMANILTVITVVYIYLHIIYKKTGKKLKTALIFIVTVLIILLILGIIEVIESATQPINSVDKPVIYLYPEQETEVQVKVTYPERLTCTYPKYEESWKVLAEPTGDLTDLETGRSLYCLYYEAEETIETSKDEGFIVKRDDTISFLEEKLEILGLTERESNEFIIYWLPKLEASPYNFIRFQTIEEINENMPLEINPTPDTVIRVMMEYEPLTKFKEVKEQVLITPLREGFTVVEWGGTEIK